ncbi:MAG: FkbM family methyltransferase [Rhodobacteraceae bacterium]|nr:FkbM family methyltransferase [Paracoccaceae bacterium]
MTKAPTAHLTVEQFTEKIAAYQRTRLIFYVEHQGRRLAFWTPNLFCLWRAQTMMSKEPITISWLDSLPEGGTLLDIGANVGTYSIYAGVMRNARVFAFEPEASNYAVLCENIAVNHLSDRAIAWCAALSDAAKIDRIYLSERQTGGSCHSFGEKVDAHLREVSFPHSQGAISTTIDTLVDSGVISAPDYIKIDVDGIEHKIIRGAQKTLANPHVRSLLIEINSNLPEHREIIANLEHFGFKHDPKQFDTAKRTEGFFAGVGEYVFRR